MAIRPNKYPDEVWVAIKTLWESVPKISWREVLEQVGSALQSKMPSEKVCRTRCEKEGWEKIGLNKGLKQRSKSDKKDPDLDLNSTSKNIEKSDGSDWSYADYKNSVSEVEFNGSKNVDPTPIIQMAQRSIDMRAEVIQTQRDRCENMNTMFDQIMAACPTQNDVLHHPNKANDLITMAAKRATVLEMLTRANVNITKQAYMAWGITEEMFQDGKSEERLAQIKELEATLEVAHEDIETQRQQMMERQRLIVNGEFMTDTGHLIEYQPDSNDSNDSTEIEEVTQHEQ